MLKRRNIGIIIIALSIVLMIFTAGTFLQPQGAVAELRDSTGKVVGQANFIQQTDGVRITVDVKELTPGMHGIHIHAIAMCSHPNFTSAGGHYNPGNKKHGLKNPDGPHAGDLPNIEVNPDGKGRLEYLNPHVTLAPEATNSLFKVNGTSLVIHAQADDEITDPTGNSGARIACGPIVKAGSTFNLTSIQVLMLIIAVVLLVIGIIVLRSREKNSTVQIT